ncbi:hypothetical protein F4678DRAFT_197025 [Xylaria arbuscula]|nr:hypothetical protein F4678DRAFT_197025 [Xylaria arbuscula]
MPGNGAKKAKSRGSKREESSTSGASRSRHQEEQGSSYPGQSSRAYPPQSNASGLGQNRPTHRRQRSSGVFQPGDFTNHRIEPQVLEFAPGPASLQDTVLPHLGDLPHMGGFVSQQRTPLLDMPFYKVPYQHSIIRAYGEPRVDEATQFSEQYEPGNEYLNQRSGYKPIPAKTWPKHNTLRNYFCPNCTHSKKTFDFENINLAKVLGVVCRICCVQGQGKCQVFQHEICVSSCARLLPIEDFMDDRGRIHKKCLACRIGGLPNYCDVIKLVKVD